MVPMMTSNFKPSMIPPPHHALSTAYEFSYKKIIIITIIKEREYLTQQSSVDSTQTFVTQQFSVMEHQGQVSITERLEPKSAKGSKEQSMCVGKS